MTESVAMLHLSEHREPSGDAVIVGTPPALARLRAAIDRAIACGSAAADVMEMDKTGYTVLVIRNDLSHGAPAGHRADSVAPGDPAGQEEA